MSEGVRVSGCMCLSRSRWVVGAPRPCCCSVVQSLSRVRLFAPPRTAACQASLFFTISQSFLKLVSIESMMPSNISSSVTPFSSCLQSFPVSRSFPISQLFTSGGHNIGASASVLPMNIQGLFPLGLISLLSKGLSRAFSSTIVPKHQFFSTQPSLWSNSYICTRLLGKP